jgi:hypothetical protein
MSQAFSSLQEQGVSAWQGISSSFKEAMQNHLQGMHAVTQQDAVAAAC